jgi:hypothetical protein
MLRWVPPFKVPVCCQNRLHHAFRGVASHGPPLAEPVLQNLELARADPVSGGIFFDCDTSRRICVANDASAITVHECGETAPRVSAGNWQVDFVAAIESEHLVRATPDREAAFESKRQRGREDRHAAPRIQPPHPMPRGLTETAGERLAEMMKVLRDRCRRSCTLTP